MQPQRFAEKGRKTADEYHTTFASQEVGLGFEKIISAFLSSFITKKVSLRSRRLPEEGDKRVGGLDVFRHGVEDLLRMLSVLHVAHALALCEGGVK